MGEWILMIWMLNCGWDCDEILPRHEPFESWDECQKELVKWINDSEQQGGGKCIRLRISSN